MTEVLGRREERAGPPVALGRAAVRADPTGEELELRELGVWMRVEKIVRQRHGIAGIRHRGECPSDFGAPCQHGCRPSVVWLSFTGSGRVSALWPRVR